MRDYEKLRQERFAALKDPTLKAYFTPKRPPLREMGVAGMRRRREQAATALTDPAVRFEDVVIAGPHGPIPTRIFTPVAKASGPRGIYLHTHGGGFVSGGGLGTMTPANLRIAKTTDCIVVAPDFRLPPEHRFPIPLDDCFAAFQWTAKNATRLGGRPDGIATGGGCTGGNIATAITIMARDAGGPQFAALYPWAPVFDLRADYPSHWENSGPGYTLSHDDCLFVYEQYLGDWSKRYDPRASVILAKSLKGLPPTHIHVGEWDVLRDESIAFANRLRDAGVEVEIVVQPEESHGPTPVTAPLVEQQMAAFLARTVGPKAPRRRKAA